MATMGSEKPTAREVMDFHTNADTDSDKESIHHTLGVGANQAAPGGHRHDGTDSFQLLEGVAITGSRSSGAATESIITALVALGAVDETVA